MRAFSLRKLCWSIEQEIIHYGPSREHVNNLDAHLRCKTKERLERLLAYAEELAEEQARQERMDLRETEFFTGEWPQDFDNREQEEVSRET